MGGGWLRTCVYVCGPWGRVSFALLGNGPSDRRAWARGGGAGSRSPPATCTGRARRPSCVGARPNHVPRTVACRGRPLVPGPGPGHVPVPRRIPAGRRSRDHDQAHRAAPRFARDCARGRGVARAGAARRDGSSARAGVASVPRAPLRAVAAAPFFVRCGRVCLARPRRVSVRAGLRRSWAQRAR